MTRIAKRNTIIGKVGKIKPKGTLDKPSIQGDYDDNSKPNKLAYYILIGITLTAIISVGFLGYKYFETQDSPSIETSTTTAIEEPVKESINNYDDFLIDDQDQLEKNSSNVNLDPKTKEEQHSLGVRYLKGIGVNKNYQEAIKWFTLSATQEYPDSQLLLGKIYYYGEFVKPDFKKAIMWNTLAAAQGLSSAQYMLGLIYEYGHGVQENKVEAKKWYSLAAAQGLPEAQEKLKLAQSNPQLQYSDKQSASKIVTQEDLSQVTKYLSNIQKNKTILRKEEKEREIIWN